MKFLSFNVIITVVVIGYMINIVYDFVYMFIPPKCDRTKQKCIKSYLMDHPHLDLYVFSSVKGYPNGLDVSKVLILKDFDYKNPFKKEIELQLPLRTRNNGTLYLFLATAASKKRSWSWDELYSKAVVEKVPLITFTPPQTATFNLLNSKSASTEHTETDKSKSKERPVAHLKSSVSFSILSDPIDFPNKELPGELVNYLRFTPEGEYLPILQYNVLKSRLSHLVEVKKENHSVNVTLEYEPGTIGKMKVLTHFGMSLKTLRQIGFNDKDIDDVKGMLADTNLYLLCATIVISFVHLLLDMLAFKNDISFWRGKKSMAGLSGRTVLWRAFSQTVIFLFLIEEKTSLLILIPTGLGTLIEFWKVKKMWHVSLDWKNRKLPSLKFATEEINQAEKNTRKVDAEAMKYLMYILYPLCLFGAAYSLIYLPHKSWYAWCLQSMVNGVYAFGFLFMLPQLFINYKLKSVAALPWRSFMYKAFNTFIDDVFAFIITMPVAHRVACFRDDIVFIIYLYQRWLYPVDKSRVDDTQSIEMTVDDTVEGKKNK